MGYTQATRYQLGTALLSGRERMVLSSNDRLFDLSTLLDQLPFIIVKIEGLGRLETPVVS